MTDHGLEPQDFAPIEVGSKTLARVIGSVRKLCGWRVFPQGSETFRLDTDGSPIVFLPTKHLVAVETVRVAGREVDVDHVQWSADGMLRLPVSPAPGLGVLEVTVTHGYKECPPELLGVIRQMLARAAQPAGAMTVGGITMGAASSATPQSTEWAIIRQHSLGPIP